MFFYGTLKRGGSNHAYCRGGLVTAEARVEGLLYDLPQGYPALVVPEASVLAVGTGDPLRDARGGPRWIGPNSRSRGSRTSMGSFTPSTTRRSGCRAWTSLRTSRPTTL